MFDNWMNCDQGDDLTSSPKRVNKPHDQSKKPCGDNRNGYLFLKINLANPTTYDKLITKEVNHVVDIATSPNFEDDLVVKQNKYERCTWSQARSKPISNLEAHKMINDTT